MLFEEHLGKVGDTKVRLFFPRLFKAWVLLICSPQGMGLSRQTSGSNRTPPYWRWHLRCSCGSIVQG